MLNPERAKEMLRSMQSPDWLTRRVKRPDSLRPDLRVSALAIMGLMKPPVLDEGVAYDDDRVGGRPILSLPL